jgi:hypothetical protein
MTNLINAPAKQTRVSAIPFRKGIALAVGALVLYSVPGCGLRHGSHGDLSPEQMLAKIDRGAEWVLWKADATDEQKTKVAAILDEMAPDALRLRNEHQTLKARFIKVLEADQVSPEELAQIRKDGLSLAERAFNRGFDAMLESAKVLSPDQRKVLAQSWKDR